MNRGRRPPGLAGAMAGVLGMLACAAAGAAPLDMAGLISLRSPAAPQVSPDGRRVAFLVSRADTLANRTVTALWWAPADGSAPEKLAAPGFEDVSAPRWSPDGEWLGFLSRGPSTPRGHRGSTVEVWRRPAGGGAPACVTKAARGVADFRWAPGGALVYRTRAAAPHRGGRSRPGFDAVVERPDSLGWEFFRQPLAGGAVTRLFRGDAGIRDWDLSPDGLSIAYSSNVTGLDNDEPLFDLWWAVGTSDEEPTQLTARYGPDTRPLISPDQEWVAFQADRDSSVTYSQEILCVVSTRNGARRCLTAHDDISINQFVWKPDATALWVEVPFGADNGFVEIPLDGSGARRLAATQGPGVPPFSSELSRSADGRVLAWIGEGPDLWPDVWVARAGETPRRLTHLNPGLDTSGWPRPEPFAWTSPDGARITGMIMRPVPATPPPWPAVAYPHGGPFNRATLRWRGGLSSLVLATHGYLVFDPNYRGSRGFGQDFGMALRGDPGGVDLGDILSGLDTLVAAGLADGGRLGIAGGSYGGYLALQAIATTHRFQAAVSLYGISSFLTDYLGSNSPSFEEEYFGGTLWQKETLFHDRSPIFRAPAIHAPLLLLHGDADPDVPPASSREMWAALKALKRTVEFVHYPREGHGFSEPNHRIDAARRTLAWFDHYLKKAP